MIRIGFYFYLLSSEILIFASILTRLRLGLALIGGHLKQVISLINYIYCFILQKVRVSIAFKKRTNCLLIDCNKNRFYFCVLRLHRAEKS